MAVAVGGSALAADGDGHAAAVPGSVAAAVVAWLASEVAAAEVRVPAGVHGDEEWFGKVLCMARDHGRQIPGSAQ